MTQPSPYNRIVSFSNIQAQAPSDPLPGNSVDAELNAVKETLDQLLTNIALIQRDDGALANQSVGRDQITPEVEIGFNAPEVWVTGTAYAADADVVFQGSGFYRCEIAHTAGVFATDLAAGKWELIVDLAAVPLVTASQVANVPAGSTSATTVQAAIDELAAEKAALSHTHVASAISDSTAAGRNLLKAADVPTQRDLLGLGALALLDEVSVSDIPAQLAFSGILLPSPLVSDTHNWAPTGIATSSTIRVRANAGTNITGIDSPTVDGTILIIENTGAQAFNMVANSTSSAAANRFLFTRTVTLYANDGVVLKYDKTEPGWRMLTANGKLPRGHLGGFTLTNGTDATNDINFASGEARDSGNSIDLVGEAMTKRLDASWSAGDGNGMRSSASLADGTWHLFVIGKRDGTTDRFAHTALNPTSVLPTDYVFYRRVGSAIRKGSTILGFSQSGDWFYLDSPVLDVDDVNSATAAFAAITVPDGLALEARMNVFLSSTNNEAWVYAYAPSATALNPSDTVAPLSSVGVFFNTGTPNTTKTAGQLNVLTNTSSQIKIDGKGAGTMERRMATVAWRDRRGRDD